MNRKRLFTICIAIAIAGMLIALPYESNAIGVGAVIGAFVVGAIIGHWLWHNAHHNVVYTGDADAYREAWNDKLENIKNQVVQITKQIQNTIEVFNQTDLYYVRYAERKALEHLDEENFSDFQDELIDILENDTKHLYVNSLKQLLCPLQELEAEMGALATGYIRDKIYLVSGSWTYPDIATSDKSAELYIVVNPDMQGKAESWHNWLQSKTAYCSLGADLILNVDFENITADELLTKNVYFIIDAYDVSSKAIVHTQFFWGGTSYGNSGVDISKAYISPHIGGQYGNGYNYKQMFSWINKLKSVYESIKDNALTNANALWSYYKSLGYTNISQIPDDEIPVFPDVVLDNVEAIGNMSYADAYTIYIAFLRSLANSTLLNQSTITWQDVRIANFSGKVANITLVWANATENETKFTGNAYIIPLEQDLTLEKDKAYVIAKANVSSSILDIIKNKFNVSMLNPIRQQLYIYDVANSVWYYIIPSSNEAYGFYVHELFEDNKSVNTVVLDISNVERLYFYTPSQNETLPIFSDNSDLLSILGEYKGLITIACIALGVIFTAGSRKGSGGHTLGIILLLAGIGMAIYFYILPAWESLSSFWDKLTFWD